MADKTITFTETYTTVDHDDTSESWQVINTGISGAANRVACILIQQTRAAYGISLAGVRATGSTVYRYCAMHEADDWHIYTDSGFESLGWIKGRLEY